MNILEEILAESASRHNSLCPRQVLGSRVALAGAAAVNMEVPRDDKRLLVIVETDGCFISGIETVTGCGVNHRTLRVEDYGKIAATFINIKTGGAVRVAPRLDVRQRARDYAPDEKRRYYAMLKGYQEMPTEELLTVEKVVLIEPVESIISRAGVRVNCDDCGEEIINEREIQQDNLVLCLTCAHGGYYQAVSSGALALHEDVCPISL
ncbi:MAG: formylmethanofuran dehydrogenase [Anaerolineae bacterium]|jgi:formylmethanofuran dehydrogenase subunit E|nr:formylmethanofuran dehydrogenase [Anaerolineae bacterium]MBT7074712.1 formylmethanofuran dehydrogenase [Anaerolineae bacterium]